MASGNTNGGRARGPAAPAQDGGDAVDEARLPEEQERADGDGARREADARAALGRLLRDEEAGLEAGQHEQIDAFREQIDEFREQIDEFRKQINGFGEQIDEFREQINGFGEQIDEFREQIDGFREQIDEFREQNRWVP